MPKRCTYMDAPSTRLPSTPSLDSLLREIRACRVCEAQLPAGPLPIVVATPKSRIVLLSQAPGRIAHEKGLPWDDPGGENLRRWLDVDRVTFFDPDHFAIVPMGFCYPGRGKSGDLPPRSECAPLWHDRLLPHLIGRRLTLLIGQYAQKQYLGKRRYRTLTATVQHWDDYLPQYFPLPHPSPRNNIWMKKNPWFAAEVLPELRQCIRAALSRA